MIETYHNPEVFKVNRFDNEAQAKKWLEKNQPNYEQQLHVGTNIKDGFVVFYFRYVDSQ